MHCKIFTAIVFIGAAVAAPAPQAKNKPQLPWAPDACQNTGLRFDLYEGASKEGSKKPLECDPSSINNMTPFVSGTRRRIGYGQNSIKVTGVHKASIYGTKEINTQHFGSKHTGFFFAAVKGKYTVTMVDSDDACYAYVGEDCTDTAKARGSGNGLLAQQILRDPKVEKTIDVEAGYWVPFDIRCANVMAGPYRLNISIRDPDNRLILGNKAPNNVNSVVHTLCPGNPYPTWKLTGLK